MDGRDKKSFGTIIVLRYPGMDTVRHITMVLQIK